MSAVTNRTVAVGVFADRHHAREAIAELKALGFTEAEIGVASRHDANDPEHDLLNEEKGNHAGAGAAAGVAGGLGVGALWGLGILAGVLPAIGPVIAGGILASIAASAAVGAAAGGLVGALVGMGIPNEEAEYYESEFRQGRTIVTVRADDRYDEVRGLFRRFGAYDMSSRNERVEASASPMTQTREAATLQHAERSRTLNADREDTAHIELREERLQPRKETTRAGEVKVRKEIVTEKQQIEVPVEREEIVIERRPASSAHHAAGTVGETEEIRIPVKEEHARVVKETVATGEVDVKKRTVRSVERVEDTVKKERLVVDKQGDVDVRDAACDTNLRDKNRRS